MGDRHHGNALRTAASSARRCENKLAAASMRSPRSERLSTRAALSLPAASFGPNASNASPAASVRHRAATACAAHNARPACRAPAAHRPPARCRQAARPAVAPARVRCLRAAGRRAQQHRLAEAGDDGGFDADRRRAAVDDEIDAVAQDRRAHGPPWSARRGRSGWPTAPRSVGRKRQGFSAPPGDGARAPRCCRGRRSPARRPDSRRSWAAPASAAPARTLRQVFRLPHRTAPAPAPRPGRRRARSAD